MAEGWVFGLTAFMIFFLETGTLKSFGVLFNPMLETLQCPSAQLGTALGMSHSVAFILSPLTGNIARKYSNRLCVMSGGVLLAVGYLASAFVDNVFQLAITFSIAGIGMSLTFVPQAVVLMAAFPTRFALIYGAVALGGSLGMMAFAPMVEALTNAYGWRGTLIILAATNCNVVACGAAQRVPRRAYGRLNTRGPDSDGKSTATCGSLCSKLSEAASSAASWLSLGIFVEQPLAVLHLTVWCLQGIIFSAWMVFLVPHAVARGLPVESAVFMSTAGGFGNLVGRVVHPPVLDAKLTSAFGMLVGLCLTNAVAFFLDFVTADVYGFLLALACINGAAIGTISIIIVSASHELFEECYHIDIYVLGNFVYGLGQIMGGFIAGAFYDLTQSYDASFVALGVSSILMTTLLLTERFASGCSSGK